MRLNMILDLFDPGHLVGSVMAALNSARMATSMPRSSDASVRGRRARPRSSNSRARRSAPAGRAGRQCGRLLVKRTVEPDPQAFRRGCGVGPVEVARFRRIEDHVPAVNTACGRRPPHGSARAARIIKLVKPVMRRRHGGRDGAGEPAHADDLADLGRVVEHGWVMGGLVTPEISPPGVPGHRVTRVLLNSPNPLARGIPAATQNSLWRTAASHRLLALRASRGVGRVRRAARLHPRLHPAGTSSP